MLIPELRNPAVNVRGRTYGVEIVKVVLGKGFLGTIPHQADHPRDEGVAEGIRIDGINLGFVPGVVSFFEDAGLEVDFIEIFADWLEVNLGVRKIDCLGRSSGGGRETSVRGGSRIA